MLARLIDDTLEQIDLVENSGIQFTDYEAWVDWSDSTGMVRHAATGYFLSRGQNEPYVRLRPDEGEQEVYRDPAGREIDPGDAVASLNLSSSLGLYDGVWFPLPYFTASGQSRSLGPWCWARCRIVDITKRKEEEQQRQEARAGTVVSKAPAKELSAFEKLRQQRSGRSGGKRCYHVTIAFDTRVEDGAEGPIYYLPTARDVNAGSIFTLSGSQDEHSQFLKALPDGAAWVNEWAAAIFTKLARERLEDFARLRAEDAEERMRTDHLHEQHYLNVLAFLNLIIKPRQVRLIANSQASYRTNRPVDVSLVLDIGNSRSCGILVEHYEGAGDEGDAFSGTAKLVLRDLNAPENEYDDPFVSRVEFAQANFDFDGKSARSKCPNVFCWPALTRVGTEAVKLSSLRQGSEGRTGLTSPKRYLWQSEGADSNVWFFNSLSYQTASQSLTEEARRSKNTKVYARPYCSYINSNGDALFALSDEDNLHCLSSGFSYRSTVTFMLSEIFLQALVQINSAVHRSAKRWGNMPRRLKTVILTVPPAMAQAERENLRSCVYEALGILWKCMGYDQSPARQFGFSSAAAQMYPPVPEVKIDWNEAEAGQIVYVYNESQQVFGGQCRAFIDALADPALNGRFINHVQDERGNALSCARIATIDIGGGTTDLVIRDYTFRKDKKEHEGDIRPYEVLATGAKIAGDDLLLELIRRGPLNALTAAIAKAGFDKSVLDRILGRNSTNVQHEVLRLQVVEQVFSKVALRILFHLEHLRPALEAVLVSGSMADFIYGNESRDDLPTSLQLPPPAPEPNAEALAWFDGQLQRYLPGFSLLQLPLEINLSALDRALREGSFDLCAVLERMCVLINQYEPDVLLLTGRPSQLPGVRAFFEERLALSPARIISMHSYACSSGWYPFSLDGIHVGDPKTTAAVGALLLHLRSDHSNFPNFRYQAEADAPLNQMHYVGIVTQDNQIAAEDVLFAIYSEQERDLFTDHSAESGVQPVFAGVDDSMAEAEFDLKLAANFGYRQFASPLSEALPLYRLEMIENVEQCQTLKKARALLSGKNLSALTETEILDLIDTMALKVPELADKFRPQLEELNVRQQQLRALLDNPPPAVLDPTEENSLRTQAGALHANDKVGVFGRLSGQKDKVIEQEFLNLKAQFLLSKGQQQQSSWQQELQDLGRQRQVLISKANGEYIEALRARLTRDFERAQDACNSSRADFHLRLKLRQLTDSADHPFPYLKRELKGKMPPLFAFEIEKLSFSHDDEDEQDGDRIRQFFKFKLRTVSDAEYWTSSGRII